MTIAILTTYKSGGDYSKEYVSNLRRGVAQHLSIDHQFICLTDTVAKETYEEETGVLWKPLLNDWPGWWSKIECFRPDLEALGHILYLDLSCLPVGDLDELASYRGKLCVPNDFYYPEGVTSSVMSYSPGAMRGVWDEFNKRPEHYMELADSLKAPLIGDQYMLNKVYEGDLVHFQDEFPGQVVSYKAHCLEGVPRNARLVKFHGQPRIHECQDPWVEVAWKSGFRQAIYEDGVNTDEGTVLNQVKYNCENQDVPWLKSSDHSAKHVCIVGGAPSLKDELKGLKLRKRLGHKIWAMNGAHDFLIENGIVPDVCVIMDARKHNTQFVQNPHKQVNYLLCSRVHSSLFDALKGYSVTMWHSYDVGVTEYLSEKHQDKPWAVFPGGNTVGLRSMTMAGGLGYKWIHVYGLDSSYREDENHAYRQDLNDGERVDDIYIGDKMFRAAPWMVRQCELFQEQYSQLSEKGVRVSIHGDGMLPYVASLMGTTNENSL